MNARKTNPLYSSLFSLKAEDMTMQHSEVGTPSYKDPTVRSGNYNRLCPPFLNWNFTLLSFPLSINQHSKQMFTVMVKC